MKSLKRQFFNFIAVEVNYFRKYSRNMYKDIIQNI